jgi:hypothetical protein
MSAAAHGAAPTTTSNKTQQHNNNNNNKKQIVKQTQHQQNISAKRVPAFLETSEKIKQQRQDITNNNNHELSA